MLITVLVIRITYISPVRGITNRAMRPVKIGASAAGEKLFAGHEQTLVVLSRWTPHPVIVTIMDNKDYITVLLYSYYTTNTGWGVLPRYHRLATPVPTV